jgi:hypothetical protein
MYPNGAHRIGKQRQSDGSDDHLFDILPVNLGQAFPLPFHRPLHMVDWLLLVFFASLFIIMYGLTSRGARE